MTVFQSLLRVLAALVITDVVKGQCQGPFDVETLEEFNKISSCSELLGKITFKPTFKDPIILPKLQKVHDQIYFSGSNIHTVDLPNLTQGKNIMFREVTNLAIFNIPKLDQVGELYFQSVRNSLPLNLSAISKLDSITIYSSDISELVGLKVKEIKNVDLQTITGLKNLDFSQLQVVKENLVLHNIYNFKLKFPQLTEVNKTLLIINSNIEFNKLNSVGNLEIKDTDMEIISFKALNKTDDSLEIYNNTKLVGIDLPNLQEVGLDLKIERNGAIKNVNLPKLTYVVGTLSIQEKTLVSLNYNKKLFLHRIDILGRISCDEIRINHYNLGKCISDKNTQSSGDDIQAISPQTKKSLNDDNQVNTTSKSRNTSYAKKVIPNIMGLLLIFFFIN